MEQWYGHKTYSEAIKEGRKEGCSLDGGLSGCNLPSLLQSQPGCSVNAPHSTNLQDKRNPIHVTSEVPTGRLLKNIFH